MRYPSEFAREGLRRYQSPNVERAPPPAAFDFAVSFETLSGEDTVGRNPPGRARLQPCRQSPPSTQASAPEVRRPPSPTHPLSFRHASEANEEEPASPCSGADTTVEERRFQRRVKRAASDTGFSPRGRIPGQRRTPFPRARVKRALPLPAFDSALSFETLSRERPGKGTASPVPPTAPQDAGFRP
jgi:hypothetical protein